MQEGFDPPETEIGISARKDVVVEQDSVSSYRPWGSMKFEEDGHLLSHAKRGLPHLDYQARSSEPNYVADLGSHAYSKESLPPGREYHRQKPYYPPSSCAWERSPSLEAVPSSPDTLGHVVGKMKTKTNTLSTRPDYVASYPTTATHMRKYPAAVKVDSGLDDSEHRYRRSDQFTAFSSHNSQSVEHCNEMVDYARGSHYVDDITPISRQWCFDDGSPSLPRGMQYGDEIPSLSSKMCNEAPSRSSLWQYGDEIPSFSRRHDYGDEIPSFSRRHDYGDEIPSLSRNWRYRDKIPLHSGHCYHYAESHPLPRYQEGVSHGNGQSRHNFARMNTNEQVKVTTSKHTSTKHRMLNRFVNSSNHYRSNMKDNPWRNSEDIMDQVRGPRAKKLNNISVSSTEKDIISPLVRRDQFNRSDFSTEYEHAKFFMIKSYSEDDIHKGIKYNVWASTPNGNNKLDAAFHEAQTLMKEKGGKCPVFLFFSVNTSGQFVGLAEMLGPVDFKKTMDFWQQDKWNGFFPVVWHIIKDIPNRLFKHIILENNDNRIVTFSRDTQEIGRPQGLQMLRIFKAHRQETSILDDFDFYEEKDNARRAQKRGNSESTHQARFSDDSKSMENLEGSMESWSLYENWD
ncbi:YTH domain-containing protein ECT2-like isoform X2 [Phragmites australis]|nr:YTH domain-containing protein ECT2-like isoform X2 [Phragmites australis]XP_062180482.1 YTH domain-containing protein ECT2-like isoform X2 [Phragmites australis]XP_062180483.1 YTH domain-containing protein ECT2-like isoform X2 [Phragmites australis]XP_062180484.1 YTH domain-containing protein ECT2-like isoform X2 [Phragmites australis]XP_062180486.1 YTH domain-containing protein ECT2-like isoform X2 [Phragmites australis]XP_062180487.1 YTH domain-containing protein ECT2-like isoform X2 [Phr